MANGAFGEVWKVHVKSGAKITYASEEFGTQPKPDTDYALKIVVDPDSQTVEGAAAKDGQCASPDILPPELAGFNWNFYREADIYKKIHDLDAAKEKILR